MRGAGVVTSVRGAFGAHTRAAARAKKPARPAPLRAVGLAADAAYAAPPCSPASSAGTPKGRTPRRRRPSAAWFDAALIRSKEFVCGQPRSGAAGHWPDKGPGEEVVSRGGRQPSEQGYEVPQISVQVGFTCEDHLGRLAMEALLANMHQTVSTALSALKVLEAQGCDISADAGVSASPLACPPAVLEFIAEGGEAGMAAKVPKHPPRGTMAGRGDRGDSEVRLSPPACHGPHLWTVGTRVFEFLEVGFDYPCSPAGNGRTASRHGCPRKAAPPLLCPRQSSRRVRRWTGKAALGGSPAACGGVGMGWVWDNRSEGWAFAM